MTDVLVCIKRVPESSSQLMLTDDAQGIDARFVGYTISAHEHSAVELAIRVADATGGTVTVVTVGPEDAVEQLRTSLALGGHAAVLVEADPKALGPADIARELAHVVTEHAESDGVGAGRSYDLVLLGNDAADSGDFQVPIRLAYALERPIVTGASLVEVVDGVVLAYVDGPDGQETYTVPLPAVVSVVEGGVEPRYPTLKGRMAAKKVAIETRVANGELEGAHRVRLLLPPEEKTTVGVLGEGPAAAGAVVDLLERLAVVR